MRHVVHDLGPVLARIFPHWWEGVTFNATVNEKSAAAFQLTLVDRLFRGDSSRHFGCDRRRVVARFATGEMKSGERDERKTKKRENPHLNPLPKGEAGGKMRVIASPRLEGEMAGKMSGALTVRDTGELMLITTRDPVIAPPFPEGEEVAKRPVRDFFVLHLKIQFRKLCAVENSARPRCR